MTGPIVSSLYLSPSLVVGIVIETVLRAEKIRMSEVSLIGMKSWLYHTV